MSYGVVAAAVLGVNLLPAFAPPTWSVLLLFTLHSHFNPVALVGIGALCAAGGRFTLAEVFRRLRGRLSGGRAASLNALREKVTARRGRAFAGLALFALSPVPSAQLFEAAGLMELPLIPLTVSFFAGRVVSYSIYVGGAHALKQSNFGRVVASSFTNPWMIAAEVAMLLLLVILVRVDWASKLAGSPSPGVGEPNGHSGAPGAWL